MALKLILVYNPHFEFNIFKWFADTSQDQSPE